MVLAPAEPPEPPFTCVVPTPEDVVMITIEPPAPPPPPPVSYTHLRAHETV